MNLKIKDKIIEDIDLIVFDKDGTLIDLYKYWSIMIDLRAQFICEKFDLSQDFHKNNLMQSMGIDTEKKCLNSQGPVGLFSREVVQKSAEEYLEGLGLKKVSSLCFEAFKEVDNVSSKMMDALVKLIPGVVELLKSIKENNGYVAIATADRTHRAELAMNFLGIHELIDIIVGSDLVNNQKPEPDMLNLINKKLNLKKNKSVMVGDSFTDIVMGKNAGYKESLAVTTGLISYDKFLNITEFVLENVSHIKIV